MDIQLKRGLLDVCVLATIKNGESYGYKMLKDMNMEIVVEGIETQSMAKQFADLNCDYIQGYYYSKPIPEDDFVEFIRRTHIA